jgi:hypothetical protein
MLSLRCRHGPRPADEFSGAGHENVNNNFRLASKKTGQPKERQYGLGWFEFRTPESLHASCDQEQCACFNNRDYKAVL